MILLVGSSVLVSAHVSAPSTTVMVVVEGMDAHDGMDGVGVDDRSAVADGRRSRCGWPSLAVVGVWIRRTPLFSDTAVVERFACGGTSRTRPQPSEVMDTDEVDDEVLLETVLRRFFFGRRVGLQEPSDTPEAEPSKRANNPPTEGSVR